MFTSQATESKGFYIDNDWDTFIAQLPSVHYEQTTRWASIKSFEGWENVRIKINQSGRLVAGAQILHKSFKYIGEIGYLKYGPFFADSNPKLKDIVLKCILEVTRNLKCTYVAVHPSYSVDFSDHLKKYGFCLDYDIIPPKILIESTLLIDLSKHTNVLLKEMRTTTRQNVRYSLKSDLTFKKGCRDDIPILFELMQQTCQRRDEKPFPSSRKYFENIWDNFYQAGWCNIFLVSKNNSMICSAFAFTFGDTMRFWKFGWSGKYSRLSPSYFLYWKLIDWARSNGFRYLDLVQIEPRIAQALRNKQAMPPKLRNHRIYGSTLFKVGFGGNIVNYPGNFFRFSNPILRFSIPAMMGSKLLRNLARKAVHKFENHVS